MQNDFIPTLNLILLLVVFVFREAFLIYQQFYNKFLEIVVAQNWMR